MLRNGERTPGYDMNGGQRRMTSAARWLFIRAAKNGRDGDKRGERGKGRKGCQYLKEEPPTNSRMMEVGGISLSLTATK